MKTAEAKIITDIPSMALALAATITGIMLHKEVWHIHYYDHSLLWSLHEGIGLILVILVLIHCIQHSFWFRNYSRLRGSRKTVTTILLILGIVLAATGIILMSGSRSEAISHVHYASGILFTIIAAGHVAKRWKLFRSLI